MRKVILRQKGTESNELIALRAEIHNLKVDNQQKDMLLGEYKAALEDANARAKKVQQSVQALGDQMNARGLLQEGQAVMKFHRVAGDHFEFHDLEGKMHPVTLGEGCELIVQMPVFPRHFPTLDIT